MVVCSKFTLEKQHSPNRYNRSPLSRMLPFTILQVLMKKHSLAPISPIHTHVLTLGDYYMSYLWLQCLLIIISFWLLNGPTAFIPESPLVGSDSPQTLFSVRILHHSTMFYFEKKTCKAKRWVSFSLRPQQK